jgi:AcrR family transcriptional regulator
MTSQKCIRGSIHDALGLSARGAQRRPDDGDETRQALLEAAFEEIHEYGYQSASLSRILKKAGVTKGALYHHFDSKEGLGFAVIDEIIEPIKIARWIVPLEQTDDPITFLNAILREAAEELSEELIRKGCPLGNLTQEMAPIHEGFRIRLEQIYVKWRRALQNAFDRGKVAGTVAESVDSEKAAFMVLAGLEGCLSQAKNAQDARMLVFCAQAFLDLLNNYKPRQGE